MKTEKKGHVAPRVGNGNENERDTESCTLRPRSPPISPLSLLSPLTLLRSFLLASTHFYSLSPCPLPWLVRGRCVRAGVYLRVSC